MNCRSAVRAVIVAVLIFQAPLAYPCNFVWGYFHQVTRLRGTVVGTEWSSPQWLRQRITRGDVDLRLYEYRDTWATREMPPLVKKARTDGHGWFDFGTLQEGHYTLVVDWPVQQGNLFDVEVKQLPRPTSSVKIDVSPVGGDCSGGHEFIAFSE